MTHNIIPIGLAKIVSTRRLSEIQEYQERVYVSHQRRDPNSWMNLLWDLSDFGEHCRNKSQRRDYVLVKYL